MVGKSMEGMIKHSLGLKVHDAGKCYRISTIYRCEKNTEMDNYYSYIVLVFNPGDGKFLEFRIN